MVIRGNTARELVDILHDWAIKQSSQVLTTSTHETLYEYAISLIPLNKRSSPVEFRIDKENASVTVSMGKGVQFDNMPSSKALILNVCEAVSSGKVSEWIWECNGLMVKSRGFLQLSDTQWHSNRTNLWNLCRCILGFKWHIRGIQIKYEQFAGPGKT